MRDGQERRDAREGHVRDDDAYGRNEPGGHHVRQNPLLGAEIDKSGERKEMRRHRRAPEADGKFRGSVEERAGNDHQRHREGGDDAPCNRVREVLHKRVGMKQKADQEECKKAAGDDGPDDLAPPVERERVFHAPAEAGARPAIGVGRPRKR